MTFHPLFRTKKFCAKQIARIIQRIFKTHAALACQYPPGTTSFTVRLSVFDWLIMERREGGLVEFPKII